MAGQENKYLTGLDFVTKLKYPASNDKVFAWQISMQGSVAWLGNNSFQLLEAINLDNIQDAHPFNLLANRSPIDFLVEVK